jgi:urate oxidase
VQTVQEIEVSVLGTGDFARAYLEGDNSTTVPTDTIKNTIYALAKDNFVASIEEFAIFLADHFLGKYEAFETITVEIIQKPWSRLEITGDPHPHSFQRGAGGIKTAKLKADRKTKELSSGIKELELLKSTGSGFVGFPRCDFTTLPEMNDRILATRVTATWRYTRWPGNFGKANATILSEFLRVFANEYSRAVQETLFRMGSVALEAVPEIDEVTLRLPNVHFFQYDLARFGMENKGEIFFPAPNPHGDIAATITR